MFDALATAIDELEIGVDDRERAVLHALRALDARDSVTYMRRWAARAKAELEQARADAAPEAEEQGSAVHLSPLLDGRGRLDGDLDPEAHHLVRTALRVAERSDVEGEPARTPAQRRADALAVVCRFFLDRQQAHAGGRHRPHVNVVVDLLDLQRGGPGRTLDGLPLTPATIRRLLCDAGVHRVVTDGASSILDYGHTTRTIPPAVYTSLLLRDLGCRFPGCDRPGEWCEGHHVVHRTVAPPALRTSSSCAAGTTTSCTCPGGTSSCCRPARSRSPRPMGPSGRETPRCDVEGPATPRSGHPPPRAVGAVH